MYVRPDLSGEGQSQVSTNGGCQPRLSRPGKELFCVEDDALMAVEVTTSPVFEAGLTTALFSDPHLRAATNQVSYDVSTDGSFVLMDSEESAEAKPLSIHVVQQPIRRILRPRVG